MDFITKLDLVADRDQLMSDLANLLVHHPWPERYEHDGKIFPANQLGISYRPGAWDIIRDAQGTLYDHKLARCVGKESDFTEINQHVGTYTRSVLEQLSDLEKTKLGRIRYMNLQSKSGLSVHKDFETRYHFVLKTNPYAYFGEHKEETDLLAARCYHIPADGYCYKMDTVRDHFVFNGGWENRIHLVICKA